MTKADVPEGAAFLFPPHAAGKRAAADYMARLKERTEDRDKRFSPMAMRAQLKAIRAAGLQAPHDLGRIRQSVLVANGDNDVMVASEHSADMTRRLPDAKLVSTPTPVTAVPSSITSSSCQRSWTSSSADRAARHTRP
jgi:pimeloyl-ACP methyl ester carboxylesterase